MIALILLFLEQKCFVRLGLPGNELLRLLHGLGGGVLPRSVELRTAAGGVRNYLHLSDVLYWRVLWALD